MYLITGASQGIGFECARLLLERTPAPVMITARRESGLMWARDLVPPVAASRLQLQVCDQSRVEHIDRLLDELDRATEEVTGVILNVGVNPANSEGPRRLHTLTLETIRGTVTTNCIHLTYLSSRLLQRLRGREGACVIWIGSMAAEHPLPGSGVYAACKSFLSALVLAAHHEYRSRGLRVHLVHPGPTRTPRTARLLGGATSLGGATVREARDVGARIVDILLDPAFPDLEVRL